AVGAALVAPVENGHVVAARLQIPDGLEIALDEVATALENAHCAAPQARTGARRIAQHGAVGRRDAARDHADRQLVAGTGEELHRPRRGVACPLQRLRTSVNSPSAALTLIE